MNEEIRKKYAALTPEQRILVDKAVRMLLIGQLIGPIIVVNENK